jgi:hypothetical protein
VIQEKFTWGANNTGAATYWIDGRQIASYTNISTYGCTGGLYPVLENYRPYPTYVNGSTTTYTNTVWYGGIIRGNTFADVAIP